MGQAWDNERAARRLLRYFIGRGETADIADLIALFASTRGFAEEFEAAVSYAHEQGWIEYKGAQILLTQKGFEQPHEFP